MATANPFDLLGDDDNDDVSQLAAKVAVAAPVAGAQPKKAQVAALPAKSAKLPTKPPPPSQAVKEGGRGGGRGFGGVGHGYGGGQERGYGRGRGGGGYNRERSNDENSNGFSAGGYSKPEEGDRDAERRGGYGAPRGSFRGGRRGGFNNGEEGEGERPRRTYDRRSGTGRGGDFKRDGAGRGNWGTATDEIAVEVEPGTEVEKVVDTEKVGETEASEKNKESGEEEQKEKEPEDNEMTLEEYEKVLEEKRKALAAMKTEERKVDLDKELKSMLQLSSKKTNDEIFIKLGSEKDKKKEAAEKEERAKKVSINEFLKPADGESQRNYGGRRGGRGGRGSRGGFGGEGRGGGYSNNTKPAPSIADTAHFPSLGGK